MANPNITLLGASYTDVAGVTLPKTGGGTATFPWVEGSQTITQNGTVDVTNLAQVIVNVAGGGGGFEYETGTYNPSSDIARPTIDFTNTHSEAPALVAIADQSNIAIQVNTCSMCVIFSPTLLFGSGYVYQNTTKRDVVAYYSYRGSSGSTLGAGGTHIDSSSISTWVSKTGFSPYTNSGSRYWRGSRTYKWIAIWK